MLAFKINKQKARRYKIMYMYGVSKFEFEL